MARLISPGGKSILSVRKLIIPLLYIAPVRVQGDLDIPPDHPAFF